MPNEHLPVTTMFREMISQGHISPVEHMENLRLPGEFIAVPSITTYGTPEIPIRTGVDTNAQLAQRTQRNFRHWRNF
jgi:hypothetical protein